MLYEKGWSSCGRWGNFIGAVFICKASVLKYNVKEGGFVRVMPAGQLASVGASAQKEEGKEEISGNNNSLSDPSLMSVSQHPSLQSYEIYCVE